MILSGKWMNHAILWILEGWMPAFSGLPADLSSIRHLILNTEDTLEMLEVSVEISSEFPFQMTIGLQISLSA